MEPASDWARLKRAFDEEQLWRERGELAIRQEMERRLTVYFERKAEQRELARIAAALPPRPRLVPMATTGHMNPTNKRNLEAALNGQPRQRDINQMRREAVSNGDEQGDIRRWRQSPR